MNLKSWALPLLTALILSCGQLPGLADPPPALNGDQTIPNIGFAKKLCKDYIQSGRYADEIKSVDKEAKEYIDDYIAGHKDSALKEKLALVLDIDETSLSNAPHLLQFDYGYLPAEWDKWIFSGKAPAIDGTLDLYKHAQDKGLAIFFLTGRNETQRVITVRNLEEVGYHKWTALIMKPESGQVTSKDFKTFNRKQLTDSGYHIIVNVGDQMSDLEGGYADSVYKLPNPMYYVP